MSYYRRLATLLGADPAQATADDVRKLLNNPLAAEGQDLDHKLEPHANGTEGGGELAKDIAAFANSTGGVLILGLQDDRKTSIPVHASPIQLTDGLRRRYNETLASRTAPILDVDIHFAKETHTPDGQVPLGFALVMVPPSPRSPHAVLGLTDLRDGCLRFPVRSGSRTRFMNPTEVETAFLDKQNRHAQRELRHDQLLDAIEEQKGFSPVRTSAPVPAKPDLTVTLVPHAPGTVPWDRSAFERYQRQLRTETTLLEEPHTTFNEVEPVADGFVARQDPGSPRQVIAVFTDDGSAGVAYPLSPQADRVWYGDNEEVAGSQRPLTLSTGELTEVVVSALGLLGRHAVDRAGVLGGCAIRITLTGPPPEGLAGTVSRAPVPVRLTSGSRPAGYASAEIGAFVEDFPQPGPALFRATDLLLTRLGRRFGQIESVYTTREGDLVSDKRTPHFPGALYRWAERQGIAVQDHSTRRP
ncbi:AlbA family DNA-binding domain-containing protein [Streptomyces sp. GQFP]|uniref:AlbA family DNA-binding domain-containing protein n=1 Tax=Streptomyces sp. GQFP TaxID=2907545 RepID=UPI001F39ACF0|nr:ATP-binding protein [Streptomyces sp. GQFP]UIX34137.1 ATP-binding protein [Streptomyces sp. GQFP]